MTTNDGPAIDLDLLNHLEQDTSRALMPELIGIFLETAEARVGRMKSAVARPDFSAIAQEAHALKSSSATFGALVMQRLSLNMENAAKEERSEELAMLMDDLDKALDATEVALKEHIKEYTSVD